MANSQFKHAHSADIDDVDGAFLLPSARIAVLVIALIIFVRNAWVGDDSFIVARVVDNFIAGYGLRWNVEERVQVFTSPLWTMLLTIPYFFSHEFFFTTIALSIVLSLWCLWLIQTRLESSTASNLIAIAFVLGVKSYFDYTVGGLENPLTNLLLVFFWISHLRGVQVRGAFLILSFLSALILLTRIDNVCFVAPILAQALWHNRRKLSAYIQLILGFVPVLMWEVFSVVYYGFAFPNTYYAKLATGIPSSEYWQQGGKYLIDFAGHDPAGFFVYASGLIAGLWLYRTPSLWIAIGMVCHTLYVVSIGGDFMAGRFFSASIIGALVIVYASPIARSARAAAPFACCLLIIGLTSADSPMFASADYKKSSWNGAGIADERGWYFRAQGLIALSGASLERASRIGPRRVDVTNVIGLSGYRAGPGVFIVDGMALSDPFLARLPAFFDPRWRIGHFHREKPAGYFESLQQQKNLVADRDLATFYEKLSIITRGPVWSLERLRLIVEMNLGRYQSLIDHQRYRYGDLVVPWERVSDRKDDHTEWNAEGVYSIAPQGVRVLFNKIIKAESIDVGLDCNEEYDLVFIREGKQIGRMVTDVSNTCPGIFNQTYRLPRSIMRGGFDTIYVKPRDGDGKYSLGHLIPNV